MVKNIFATCSILQMEKTMKLYTMYIEIFNKLDTFCNDWKQEKESLTRFQKASIEKKAAADSSLLEELQEISKKESY